MQLISDSTSEIAMRGSRHASLRIGRGPFVCAICLTLGFAMDSSVAHWAERVHLFQNRVAIGELGEFAGTPVFAVLAVIGVTLLHPSRWRAGALLGLTAAGSGIMVQLIKWMTVRPRPWRGFSAFEWNPFAAGTEGIAEMIRAAGGSSFPSGHTALAFSISTTLSHFFPRRRVLFHLAAVVVAMTRILQGAHYVSDVVAGAGVGMATFWMIRRLMRGFSTPLRNDRSIHPCGTNLFARDNPV